MIKYENNSLLLNVILTPRSQVSCTWASDKVEQIIH